MKLLNARITILIGQEGTRIELYDRESCTQFAEINLTPAQLSQALSRLAHTECEIELRGLNKVGKRMEMKPLTFPISVSAWDKSAKDEAVSKAQSYADKGWEADTYFGSRESFQTRDGITWANTQQRRWVEVKA